MRILTFNLWHGLAPKSPLAFEALEPAGRRELREQVQIQLLKELNPDICFFQEANPVTSRGPAIASALRMEYALQPDLVGLKIFGLGLPLNLNSGLVTTIRKSHGLRHLQGVSLSRPGTAWVHPWASYQLKEERFALFSETMLPEWGKVLLVNTHLHHGLEPTADFIESLEKAASELELASNVVTEIKHRLEAGPKRRAQELKVLLDMISQYERRYETVLVAGDFNTSPASDISGLMRETGFHDVWSMAHPNEDGFTFDAVRNEANHMMQARFPLTLVVEDLSFSPKIKEALLALARKQEGRPRRIDYLWIRTNSLKVEAKKVELAGLPVDGFAPSDHFGVCADLEVG